MTAGVVRVGDNVRRPATSNLPFVAELRGLLERSDARVAPRYLGQDVLGRSVVEWIDGDTTTYPSERNERACASGGRALRRVHDITAGHPLAAGAECVVHGDPGPFTTICRAGMPVAFIDWDSAGPGERLTALAYVGWTWCVQSAGGVPVADQARRLSAVLETYGDVDDESLLAALSTSRLRMADTADQQLARPALPTAEREHWTVTLEWATSDHALFAANLFTFRRALG